MDSGRISDRGAEALVAAVILQACRDYKHYRARADSGQRGPCRMNGEDVYSVKQQLEDVERFFLGRWFKFLYDRDGAVLLDKIREMDLSQLSLSMLVTDKFVNKESQANSWKRLAAHPALQKKLRAHKIRQGEISREIGINMATLSNWLKSGLLPQQLRRIEEAADNIISRRNGHAG